MKPPQDHHRVWAVGRGLTKEQRGKLNDMVEVYGAGHDAGFEEACRQLAELFDSKAVKALLHPGANRRHAAGRVAAFRWCEGACRRLLAKREEARGEGQT